MDDTLFPQTRGMLFYGCGSSTYWKQKEVNFKAEGFSFEIIDYMDPKFRSRKGARPRNCHLFSFCGAISSYKSLERMLVRENILLFKHYWMMSFLVFASDIYYPTRERIGNAFYLLNKILLMVCNSSMSKALWGDLVVLSGGEDGVSWHI